MVRCNACGQQIASKSDLVVQTNGMLGSPSAFHRRCFVDAYFSWKYFLLGKGLPLNSPLYLLSAMTFFIAVSVLVAGAWVIWPGYSTTFLFIFLLFALHPTLLKWYSFSHFERFLK